MSSSRCAEDTMDAFVENNNYNGDIPEKASCTWIRLAVFLFLTLVVMVMWTIVIIWTKTRAEFEILNFENLTYSLLIE